MKNGIWPASRFLVKIYLPWQISIHFWRDRSVILSPLRQFIFTASLPSSVLSPSTFYHSLFPPLPLPTLCPLIPADRGQLGWKLI